MRVKLAYGKEGLWVDLPYPNVTVLEPKHCPGIPNQRDALRQALRAPAGTAAVRELVKPDDTVAIVFSDITRPQPRRLMLSVLLEELSHVPREQIVLINALGTHRPNTETELAEMLGPDIISGYRVEQHDAWDEGNVNLGRTASGHEVSLNAEYMRARVKILTGFIEPHFFAGFSGGPKAVLPGLADERSVMANHGFDMIGHPSATWGVTEGNPLWEEMREVALKTAPDFLFNVSLNSEKEITGVFAGDLVTAHAEGTSFVRSVAMAAVARPFDIVITSNSGYPLDLNVYQSVKGMSAAAQIVKQGGAIIMAAECWDGVPEHGDYGGLLRMAATPEGLLSIIGAPGFSRQDQWQVQIQAKIQMKAEVFFKNSYLDEDTIRATMLTPCSSIEDTVAELVQRYGWDAAICVLPEGPMTIPYIGS